LLIECSKNNRENYPGKSFEQKKKKPRLKFNPGLVLIGLRTTGPWNLKEKYFYSVCTVIKTRYLVVNVGLKFKKKCFCLSS